MPLTNRSNHELIERANLIGVDFETFYDSKEKYSLSSITAEEYINSPKFEVILCSIKINSEPAFCLDGADPDFVTKLKALPWDSSIVYAHNGAFFDFLILSWVYGIVPFMYLDTLLMARPLAGTGEKSNLASLAERYNLPAKLDTVYAMNGKHRSDISPDELEDYIRYCNHDIELAYLLLEPLTSQWRSYDLAWMDLTMKMASKPSFVLDSDVIIKGIESEKDKEGKQLTTLYDLMQERGIEISEESWKKVKKLPVDEQFINAMKKEVGSIKSFTSLMNAFGIEVPEKWSEKKSEWVPALARSDSDFMDLLDSGIPGAAELVEARLGVKSTIMSTRLDRLNGISERMGFLPIPIMPFAAHTGRNGGTMKINVQNFSSRPSASNPYGKANPCRLAITVPKKYRMFDSDLSQIEVRVLGGVSGEENILIPFARADVECPYCAAGPTILGRKVVKGVDKIDRNLLKGCILGNGYGQGYQGFRIYMKRMGMDISDTEAKRIVDAYRRSNPKVVGFWRVCEDVLDYMMQDKETVFGYNGCLFASGNTITLPSGRKIRYRGLKWEQRPDAKRGGMRRVRTFYDPVKHTRREVYGSLLCENIVQAIAADVIHEMGVDLYWKYKIRPRLQVHDSLVFAEREEREEYVLSSIDKVMSRPPSWMDWIPIDYEVEVGDSYGNLVEVK